MNHFFYNYGFSILLFCAVACLLFAGAKLKKHILTYILFNLSAVLLALFLYEIYSYAKDTHNFRATEYLGTYVKNHDVSGYKPIVGYGPRSDTNFQVSSIKKLNDSVIFDVIFSFKNGLRFTPEVNDTSQEDFIFLGCSHVFGDGLNDNQTLPHFFNQFTEKKYTVVNWAFNGYGPHHTLKIVEDILLKDQKFLSKKKKTIFYTFIASHFIRASGKVPWDTDGPWYEVENDSLAFKGSFAEKNTPDNFLSLRWNIIWKNSNLYKSFFTPKTQEKDVILTIKLIQKTHELLKKNNINFYVLITHSVNDSTFVANFTNSLKDSNISYFLLDSIIPDIEKNHDLYFIKGDGHPNEYHNKKLAEFLAKQITK